jgi:THO complex subunit 5
LKPVSSKSADGTTDADRSIIPLCRRRSQLAALARCDIDGLAVAKRLEMHPKSQLRSWREITHKEETAVDTETPGAPAADVEMVDELAAGLSEDDGARLVRRTGALGAAAAADWRDHGVRKYRAVVRAARQPGGAKHARAVPVDVVAEVIVSPEYPTRPPAFSLSLERRVPAKGLPTSDLDTKDDDANTNGGLSGKTSTDDATGSIGDASNDLRLIEEEVNAEAVNLLPPGGEDEALGYCVVRLLQAVDACAECERWGGASDEAVGVRQMRRGRERRKELPPLL